MNWRHHASCQYEDPELFFPLSPNRAAQAKAVCRECPVRRPCLAYALASGQDAGIWGGVTEEDRRTLLLRRFRARTGRTTSNPATDLPSIDDQHAASDAALEGRHA